MDYAVWFIARNISVSLHLLIPCYGYLTFTICSDCFWCIIYLLLLTLSSSSAAAATAAAVAACDFLINPRSGSVCM